MLIKPGEACLLIIDVQSRLLPVVSDPARVTKNCEILIRAARRLGLPILGFEQNPKGIGAMDRSLAALLPEGSIVEKDRFAAYAEPEGRRRIDGLGRRQVVIGGIEAHVCVAQTALGLATAGFDTFVAADATASRIEDNRRLALDRMRDAGIAIVSTEMVVFEWLEKSSNEEFRELLQLIK